MNHIQATSVWNLIQRALPHMVEQGVYYSTDNIWCWPRSLEEVDTFPHEDRFPEEGEYELNDSPRLRYTRVGNRVFVLKGHRPVALVSAFLLDRFVMDLESGHTFRMERTRSPNIQHLSGSRG